MFLGFEATGFHALGEAPEDRFAVAGSSSLSVDWEVIIYAATHEIITRPDDDPADQMLKGTLEKAFRIDRNVLGANRIGEQVTIGFGEVTLTNVEGDYDFLSIDNTPQGQRIDIRMGDRTKPYATWRTILSGFMTDHRIDRDKITFRLRDAGHQLDVPLSPNVYAGTGGQEGGEDLEGKRKPRWFGWLKEVSPVLVIPASLAYQLNDGEINSVSNVYVRGVALSFDSDHASVTEMNAASLSVGEYATCLAEGWVRIAVAGGSEIGQVTVDFAGDKAGGVFVQTTADIVRRMLGVTTIADPADLVTLSFSELNTVQPAPVGVGIPAGDESTVAQVAGRLMAGIGGWLGARRNRKFEVRRLEVPVAPPNAAYSKQNVEDVATIPMPTDISPPPWRIRVGWGRIFTPGQTNLAGTVTEERRAYLAEEVRFASAENVSVQLDFPPGREYVKGDTFFRDAADALDEAERLGVLYWSPRALYVFALSEPLFMHELGQVVSLEFDRFDLAAGKLLTIVRMTEDDIEGVELTAFG